MTRAFKVVVADTLSTFGETEDGFAETQPSKGYPDHGTIFKLSDHRGKYVLIHFWATNCRPCMTQMPAFKKKKSELADFPLEVVLVSLDNDELSFQKVKDKLGIACRHIYDGHSVSGPIAQHFGIDRMPTDVVIDPSGKFLSYTVDTLIEKASPGKPAEPSNAHD